MSQEQQVRVSCEMIIEHNGKVLMGKRGNIFGKGSYAFPGGHLEFGELVKDCVARELKEEVDIIPVDTELLCIINDYRNLPGEDVQQYIRFVFLVREFSGEIQNMEPDRCEGWEWYDKDNLPEPIFVGHAKVVRAYQENMKGFVDDIRFG